MPMMTSPPATDRPSNAERAHTLKAVAIMALLLMLAGAIAWSMWRRGKIFRGENGTAWKYQSAKAADGIHPALATKSGNPPNAIPPPNTDSLPDPTAANTPNLTSKSLKKPSPAMRLPLARPIPEDRTTTEAAPRRHKRHRRDILGLGKLWHWIRRDRHKNPE
jgi:hypothetical protein